MKFLLLFLLMFAGITCYAQYAPFPTPGLAHGEIYICNPYDCQSYFNASLRYEGDTILCGVTWNKFGQHVRADQGRYYVYVDCNTEMLLYDFSKSVGDTVITGDLGAMVVMQIGTFTLENGEIRKKMIMKPLVPSIAASFTWVDGIGDIDRGFFRYADFEGGHSQLICIRDNSGVFYHNPNPFLALDCDSLLCKVPVPSFEYNCSDETYYFTNHSLNANSYTWDFGDGESSTEINPSHHYSSSGCYIVTLKAKSDCLPQEYLVSQRIAFNTPFFWKKSPNELPAPIVNMQFLDPNRGWALGEQKIWKTIDGGAHWDTVPYPGPVRTVVSLQFKDFEHGIVEIRRADAPAYSEILWTNDGVNWETQSLGTSTGLSALERLNDSVAVVAAQYQDIFVTKDWGKTWTNLNLPGAVSLIQDFVSIGGDTVYFIGVNQLISPYNKFGFGKSYDALNWQVQEFPDIQHARYLSFVNAQQGWMSNGGSIYRTQNAGETWQFQALTPGFVFDFAFADTLHGWSCGYNTGIYATSDGGETWEQQACDRYPEWVGGLNVFSANQAYILLEDGFYTYSTIPDTIKLCATTRTEEPVANPAFIFYPNPTSGMLQWEAPGTQALSVKVFDRFGLLVKKQETINAELDLSLLNNGLYYIELKDLDGRLLAIQKIGVFKN